MQHFAQCLIPLCHGKQGANGEKWAEGVGGGVSERFSLKSWEPVDW